MEYRNQDILNAVETEASKILKEKTSNKYRDHFFPMMIDAMDYKVGVEIGSNIGEYAFQILSKSKIKRLYCVDTWQNNFGSDGYCDTDGDKRMQECKDRLKEFIDNGRCELIRQNSQEAVGLIPTDKNGVSADFVYVDGDHSLAGVLFDLYTWTPRVKVGGILGGHDFKDGPKSGIADYWGKQLDYAVKTSVEYFGRRYGFKVNPVGGRIMNWWFVKV